jgi:hypothetical protein
MEDFPLAGLAFGQDGPPSVMAKFIMSSTQRGGMPYAAMRNESITGLALISG